MIRIELIAPDPNTRPQPEGSGFKARYGYIDTLCDFWKEMLGKQHLRLLKLEHRVRFIKRLRLQSSAVLFGHGEAGDSEADVYQNMLTEFEPPAWNGLSVFFPAAVAPFGAPRIFNASHS